jgi:hypothetical protein
MNRSLEDAAICYYRIVFYTSIIGTLAFLITLTHVYKGTKHLFLIVLICLYIISNIAAILSNTFGREWIDNPSLKDPYLALQAAVSCIRDATFNLAHWIFSFKYWIIALEMQYLIERKSMGTIFINLLKVTNYTFIALDILMPCMYSTTFYILNNKFENQLTD